MLDVTIQPKTRDPIVARRFQSVAIIFGSDIKAREVLAVAVEVDAGGQTGQTVKWHLTKRAQAFATAYAADPVRAIDDLLTTEPVEEGAAQ